MKKNFILTAIAAVFFNCYNAQVGVNTGIPKATLDVIGEPSNPSKLDGIIAPRITGALLRAKTYAADQNGAVVYVTTADSAPAGQTIDVLSEGYYYYSFPTNKWIKMGAGAQANDWHTTGNSDSEITNSITTADLGTTTTGTNYLGTQAGTDNLVLVTNGESHAILTATGSLVGGGETNSALAWGSGNTANPTSNNIALGIGNTAASSAALPSVAIGSTNNLSIAGYSFGRGNNHTSGAPSYSIGNSNTISNSLGYSSLVFGNSNLSDLGANNGLVIGSDSRIANQNAILIGLRGTSFSNNSTTFAQAVHFFVGSETGTKPTTSSASTKVYINVTTPVTNSADLEVKTGIRLQGVAAPGGGTCTSADEGVIRYNSTLKRLEYCNGTNWTLS